MREPAYLSFVKGLIAETRLPPHLRPEATAPTSPTSDPTDALPEVLAPPDLPTADAPEPSPSPDRKQSSFPFPPDLLSDAQEP